MTVESTKSRLKPRAKQIAGICSAAESLGVTRGHLWAVLKGKRESKVLVAKYEAFKAVRAEKLSRPLILVPVDVAAADNLAPDFFKSLSKLGLEIVIVRFQAGHDSPIWEHPGIECELERELRAIQAGQFDSSSFPSAAQYHFYHITRAELGKAMQRLKTYLDSLALLPVTTLLHAESATELREWYPGATAALIQSNEHADA